MFTRLFLFFLSFFLPLIPIYSLPVQNASLEELGDLAEEEIEMSQEMRFNDDEEISALPKKGNRPQVIQIPTKTSSPQ